MKCPSAIGDALVLADSNPEEPDVACSKLVSIVLERGMNDEVVRERDWNSGVRFRTLHVRSIDMGTASVHG